MKFFKACDGRIQISIAIAAKAAEREGQACDRSCGGSGFVRYGYARGVAGGRGQDWTQRDKLVRKYSFIIQILFTRNLFPFSLRVLQRNTLRYYVLKYTQTLYFKRLYNILEVHFHKN